MCIWLWNVTLWLICIIYGPRLNHHHRFNMWEVFKLFFFFSQTETYCRFTLLGSCIGMHSVMHIIQGTWQKVCAECLTFFLFICYGILILTGSTTIIHLRVIDIIQSVKGWFNQILKRFISVFKIATGYH